MKNIWSDFQKLARELKSKSEAKLSNVLGWGQKDRLEHPRHFSLSTNKQLLNFVYNIQASIAQENEK